MVIASAYEDMNIKLPRMPPAWNESTLSPKRKHQRSILDPRDKKKAEDRHEFKMSKTIILDSSLPRKT